MFRPGGRVAWIRWSRCERSGRGLAGAVAEAGDAFGRTGDRGYTVRPGSVDDLAALRGAVATGDVRDSGGGPKGL